MVKKTIFVDTETTGLDYKKGHRIIEFAGIEMNNRKLTGNRIHCYLKPDIAVDEGALSVHGIKNDFLLDKPTFSEKVKQIMTFISDSELIIHNAPFDLGFLNNELSLLTENCWGKIEDHCKIVDTLRIARNKHPGKKNTLDALCKRYGINNNDRILHGASLDVKLLAEVYLSMTGGQRDLFKTLSYKGIHGSETDRDVLGKENVLKNKFKSTAPLPLATISDKKVCDHEDYLSFLDKMSKKNTLWRKL